MKTIIASAALGCLPLAAHADFSCSGSPESVAVGNTGSLAVDIGPGIWTLCDLDADGVFTGVAVTMATCKSWQALAMAAMASSSHLYIYIKSATVSGTNPAECASVGTWVTPGAYFLDSRP
jgi:hypothetical protein